MVTLITSVPLLLLIPLSMPVQATCTVEQVEATALEAPILGNFNKRVFAYMTIHDEVERQVWPGGPFENADDMEQALLAMRSGIRAARPTARRGDIFTADVGSLIRRRIEERLVACDQTVEDVLSFINEERLPHAGKPAIHKPFPWDLGCAMPASLIPALPPIPDGLEYRFADRDLVLIDMHADLVVDILPNALPAPRR